MEKILKSDKPLWINPSIMSQNELEKELSVLSQKKNIDLIIIATNPVYHYFYCKWALQNNVHVSCDKPIVLTPNASFDLSKAKEIQKKYDELEKLYFRAKKKNPDYLFGTPLRRRILSPFVKIAEECEAMYKKTNEGIRYMTVNLNCGLHRYPLEFLKGGAHGYLDGVGAMSHSCYHYIDVIAWYLQLAPGDIAKIKVSLPFILRVRDYLNSKQYKRLQDCIEGKDHQIDNKVVLPDAVLNSEVDFTFHMQLFDSKDVPIGLITFSNNNMTYTPRTVKYAPEIYDHAHEKTGGRMSQVYMDIHQGYIQNWQLIKNDVVFYGNEITILGRKHPSLGSVYAKEEYKNAYEDRITPKDLLIAFIKNAAGIKMDKKFINLVSTFETQKLTNKIFSLFYEMLAEEHESKTKKNKPLNTTILLDNYIK